MVVVNYTMLILSRVWVWLQTGLAFVIDLLNTYRTEVQVVADWAEFSTGSSVDSCLLTLVPRSRTFLPWRLKWYVPPKRHFTQDLHGATSQKTAIFIATAVKTSNLTRLNILRLHSSGIWCRMVWMFVSCTSSPFAYCLCVAERSAKLKSSIYSPLTL
jgi:hypothetical protein